MDKIKKFPESTYLPQKFQPIQYNQPYIAPMNTSNEVIDELFQYVNENDISKIMSHILENHIQLTLKNSNGDTLLHIIINKVPINGSEQQKLSLIKHFNDIKSMIITPNKNGITPLHLLAKYQYFNIINELCSDISVSPKDSNGMTPLHYAIIGYETDCNKNQKLTNDENAIDAIDVFDDTIQKIFDDDMVDIENIIDEITDIEQDLEQIIKQKYLLDEDYVHVTEQKCLQTKIDTIKSLIKIGESLNTIDNSKMTPIFYAIHNKDLELIDFLLSEHNKIQNDEHLVVENTVSVLSPININGINPIEYFKNMYSNHLSIFSNDIDIIKSINDFSYSHVKNIFNFLELHNKKIDHISELAVRTIILINEYITNIFLEEKPELFDIFMNFIGTQIKPSSRILENNVVDLQINAISKWKRMSKYNDTWRKYILDIQNNKIMIQQSFSNAIENKIVTDILNNHEICEQFTLLYNLINNFITEHSKFSFNIIEHNLSSIVCYDLHKNIMKIVLEEFRNYYESIPEITKIKYEEERLKYAIDVQKFEEDKLEIQKQEQINLILNALYIELKSSFDLILYNQKCTDYVNLQSKNFNKPNAIFLSIPSLFNLKNSQVVRMGNYPNFFKQLNNGIIKIKKNLDKLNNELYKLDKNKILELNDKKPQLINTLKKHNAILSFIDKQLKIYNITLNIDMQNINKYMKYLENIQPIDIQNMELSSKYILKGRQVDEFIKSISQSIQTLKKHISELSENTKKIIPPLRPLPPKPQQKNTEEIINATILTSGTDFYKATNKLIMQRLPLAITGFILDKDNDEYSLIQASRDKTNSLHELLHEQFISEFKKIPNLSDDILTKIVEKIKNILTDYENIFEYFINDSNELINMYFKYLSNKLLYINICELLSGYNK
jgi:hypothetical protein